MAEPIPGLRVVHCDGRNTDFIELCRLLDENLDELVGGAFQRRQYVQYNRLDGIRDVVLLYPDDPDTGVPAAAGGSFKRYDDESAEIKRVFVRREFRRRGLARRLMTELEKKALDAGFRRLILETGAPLKASIGLYRSFGFNVIENYGQYRDMASSVCMEKRLATG